MSEEEQTKSEVPAFIKKPPNGLLGAPERIKAVADRIKHRFVDDDEPYVVGLYGEWGSGKSFWLDHIRYQLVAATINDKKYPVVIPVFFNAWRYEKEEHLIIPLLKTTAVELERWQGVKNDWKDSLKGLAKELLISTASLSYAFAKNMDKAKIIDTLESAEDKAESLRRRWWQPGAEVVSKAESLESNYFDFHNQLQKALTIKLGDRSIRLLFLIDDLDRCLPEKAVEMLEAIKLFLEVEGTAFVVAVDDEVVERGIRYRYRNTQMEGESNPPITGHEYLEKIIHLPVRLDRPLDHGLVQEFVEKRCKGLHDLKVSLPKDDTADENELEELVGKPNPDKGQAGRKLLDSYETLLQKIPAVPRKLIRLSELYSLRANVLGIKSDVEKLLLLRVVAMQLFAPDVYRLAAKNRREIFSIMHNWKTTYTQFYPDFERILAACDQTGPEEGGMPLLSYTDRKMFVALAELQKQRTQFELTDLTDEDTKHVDNWKKFFERSALPADQEQTSPQRSPTGKDDRNIVQLSAAENRQLVSSLMEASPAAWREATSTRFEWHDEFDQAIVSSLETSLQDASFSEDQKWEWLSLVGVYLAEEDITRVATAMGMKSLINRENLKEIMKSEAPLRKRLWAGDVLSYLGDDRPGVGLEPASDAIAKLQNLGARK